MNHFSLSPPPPPALRCAFHWDASAASIFCFLAGFVAVVDPTLVVVDAIDDSSGTLTSRSYSVEAGAEGAG